MNAAWIPFAFLGLILLMGVGGAFISDAAERKATKRRVAMRAWLEARPTRATRDEALLQVDEAYADTRITEEEYAKFRATIDAAMTNEAIEEVVKRIVVVEKPE